MTIKERFTQFKTVAVAVGGFIKRHKRASVAVAVALLIAGPLLTGTGGEAFFLNLAGLGIIALVVRRIVRANDRKQARQANCRCRCHRQQQRKARTPRQAQQQQQGGTP